MRTRTVLLTLLLALSAAVAPAVAPVAAQSDMVTLTVAVEKPDGSAVGGAELSATWEGGSATRTTAGNGKAFIDVPESADVTIEVSHPDYIRNSPYLVTDAAEEEVQVTVYEKATASLTVVDTNGPVEGVRVEFDKGGETAVTRTTDNRGQVESGVIEAGEYSVRLIKSGYLRKAEPIDVQGDVSQQVQIERGSVSVTFLVLDDNFDPPRPVDQAAISGSEFGSVQTQADGTRSVSVPVNSQLQVTVEKDGYDTIRSTFLVREGDRQINITTRKQPMVSVSVPNQRVVVGEALQVTVTDQYDQPLSEAVVYLDGEAVGQPDDGGVVRVPIESAGDHTLYAEFDQLSSDTMTITGVEAGGGSGDAGPADEPATDAGPNGSQGLPGLGGVDLGSTAVGIAAGLVLAVVLFVYVRIR